MSPGLYWLILQIAAEGGLGNPVTYIAWKSDHVIRSDIDGSINVWDVKVYYDQINDF